MSICVDWSNPYASREGRWYKGNLHTHTAPASDCGEVPLARMWEMYVRAGYDFVAVSDHMTLTVCEDPRMVWIPGVEWNSSAGDHTGVYALDLEVLRQALALTDHRALLDHLAGQPALAILNHPNWLLEPHYRREQLLAQTSYDGIEIYNHVIERLDGYAIATDKWDYLLAKGRRVLGFATDDAHIESDVNGACIYVRAPARSAAAILDAIRRGNFYCSAGGLQLDEIRRDGRVVTLRAAASQELHAIGCGGPALMRVKQSELSFDLSKTSSSYVRFAAYGHGSAMAWTQPFYNE